ncbi:MAG: hypothetical protein GX591_15930 [Planctomycetes bacterium]|nr:hypothetical protein [Planctomycetota bacterium]
MGDTSGDDTAALRLDLPPDRRTVVFRLPSRRYALKLVSLPHRDGTGNHLARELIDADAPPERWVYVLVTTTNPQETDGF